jgi:hypothetical protein
MPLPTVNWRYCAPVTLAANTTVGMLDALYSAGTAATYQDGSARTPGSGSAWTWNRDTGAGVNVASYGTPPVNALTMQYIVAGATALPAPAPTMVAPDTNVINRINIGMNKNSGAYAGWNLAAPFTSGTFSGYASAAVVTTSVTYTTLYYWECQEGFLAAFTNAAGTQVYVCGGGALLDPAATSAGSAESDGRVYSILSTGNSTFMSTLWLSTAAGNGPFKGSTAAGGNRFYQFLPGGSGLRYLIPISTVTAAATAVTFVSPNGEFPAVPQFHFYDGNSNVYLGYLREVDYTRAARLGQRWANGGTTVGYILGPTVAADAQCCALMY